MKSRIDHPRVRAMYVCPMCGGSKSTGAVTCWVCHNECEHGTEEQRDGREARLDEVEDAERQAHSQFGAGA